MTDKDTQVRGGRGGHAAIEGDDSTAIGGQGGDGVVGPGGPGGDAHVRGNRSYGRGGRGGRGGVGEGGPGGDVSCEADDTFLLGGHGGEASQPDGRGGRGGRSPWVELGQPEVQLPDGRWMSEFGRGGEGAHSPQYEARLMVIEELLDDLAVPYHRVGQNTYCEVTEALLVELNARLTGRAWGVSVIDGLFSFFDTNT